MSYILDALRRAEAERDRGAVPGLHSQPQAAAAPPLQHTANSGPWIAAGVAGAVLVLGGLAWWVAGRQPAAALPAALPAAVPAAVAPAPPSAAVAPPPAPIVVIMPAPAPAPTAAAAPAPIAVQPVAPPAPPPAAAPAPPPRIVPFEQLPDDVKRQLPALAIGGAVYSERAADRLLIVGGQLLHEGDSAAPGVVLEQIKPRAAVLRWRELRYEVTF
jgi:general secretion pathway protein B